MRIGPMSNLGPDEQTATLCMQLLKDKRHQTKSQGMWDAFVESIEWPRLLRSTIFHTNHLQQKADGPMQMAASPKEQSSMTRGLNFTVTTTVTRLVDNATHSISSDFTSLEPLTPEQIKTLRSTISQAIEQCVQKPMGCQNAAPSEP